LPFTPALPTAGFKWSATSMLARGGFRPFSLRDGKMKSSPDVVGTLFARQLVKCTASRGCKGTGRLEALDLGLPNWSSTQALVTWICWPSESTSFHCKASTTTRGIKQNATQARAAKKLQRTRIGMDQKKWWPSLRGLTYLRKLVRIRFLRLRNGRADDFGTVKVVLIGVEHAFKASIPRS
jgi:hypothetical protein